MSRITSTENRRRLATVALASLGRSRPDHQRLSVQCPHGHHVATVFDTDLGLVVRTLTGPHGHGSKDFLDTAHHAATHGQVYVDVLDPGATADDALPAWCDCGPRSLSRAELRRAVRPGHHTWHLP
jgi:hypothetical protein